MLCKQAILLRLECLMSSDNTQKKKKMILLWWVHWMEVIYTRSGYLHSLHIPTSTSSIIFLFYTLKEVEISLQILFNVKVTRLYAIATCYGAGRSAD